MIVAPVDLDWHGDSVSARSVVISNSSISCCIHCNWSQLAGSAMNLLPSASKVIVVILS
jgi:hypothetical protein